MKKDIFKEIEKYCPADAIIATSAMKLPINEIFDDLETKRVRISKKTYGHKNYTK